MNTIEKLITPRCSLGIGMLLALCAFVSPAAAQVPTCEALSLYGNAFNQKLCKSLSPTTQNLWVCGLTSGATDVHTTFNAGNPLHITVRVNPGAPTCQANSVLAGNWPGHLAIAAGQPAMVCNVNVQTRVDRLNAVDQLAAGGSTLCRAGFLAALANGGNQALMQSYLDTCAAMACP